MLADRDADSSLDEAERIVAQPLLRETARQLPQEERPTASDTQRDAPRESLRRPWVRRMLFLLLPLALIAGSAWYVVGGRVMYTDDAYVNANQVGISTDVAGTVAEVDVHDNQEVSAGQVLYRLDALQFVIALANAKANRAQVALTLESMKRDYRRMVTDAAAELSQVALDRTRYERATRLLTSGVESRAGYDQAQYTLRTDQSKLEALREEARVQLARLGDNPNTPATQLPQYQQANAQVAEAERELLHTVVRPGQPASVRVDTYPGVRWYGTVESLSPAAAQEFSLLPAQNTSGNWVKVVQRVQMRIRVDTGDARMPPLRAGMSTEVYVDTGHPRGLPHFLTALF